MADRLKRASYREAIRWIAYEDDAGSSHALELEELRGVLTVCLTADLFGVEPERIARDVIRLRNTAEWREWANRK